MNEKLLLALSLFCPSEYHFKKQMESIQSLAECINDEVQLMNLVDVQYAGWVKSDEHWNLIETFIKNSMPYAQVFRLDKNYGKSCIVNKIVFDYYKQHPNCQFFLTWDSDMIMMKDQNKFFMRILLVPEVIQKNTGKSFGLVAANQYEENCHWLDKMPDHVIKYQINNLGIEEVYTEPTTGNGIAGGVWMVNIKAFVSVGGYQMKNDVYSGDDAYLLLDFAQRGYSIGILKTLFMRHPITIENKKYIEWKAKSISTHAQQFDKSIFEANVNSSMEFWNQNPEG